MPHEWKETEVICPYYVRGSREALYCERLIREARAGSVVSRFMKEEEKKAFMRKACCTHEYASRCRIAEAHERYWSGESKVK